MQFAEFENLLKQKMGLDAASIGLSAVSRAVQERLTACKLKDLQVYWNRVNSSAEELQELIEAVVVPETWFFRNKEAFAALTQKVSGEWLRKHPQGVLRLLSLPCSTGEEPYSMAIALLESGFPPERFHIDAVDISVRALSCARQAVYRSNSFRGNDLTFCDRYFRPLEHGYQLLNTVRKNVHFHQENLFDGKYLSGTEVYDVVFCRNLLIYFDRPTQDKCIEILNRLLHPEGYLFVGSSETALLLSHNFVSAKMPLAFAFRKAALDACKQDPSPSKTAQRVKKRTFHPKPLPAPKSIPLQPLRSVRAGSPSSHIHEVPLSPERSLAEAEKLVDQGRMIEAAACCEEYLRNHGPSAPVFFLLGLARDVAQRQREAVDLYRKALYLDPEHHAALVHLAFLLEKEGDVASAQRLRHRARRAQSESYNSR